MKEKNRDCIMLKIRIRAAKIFILFAAFFVDIHHPLFYTTLAFVDKMHRAPVAQLDRAPDYGSGGLGFESLRVCHVSMH